MLERIRSGERIPLPEVFDMGENCPAEFFRIVIESLSDSFEPRDAAAYETLMQAWPVSGPPPLGGGQRVYVLSRITLGSDIKITSMVLDAMKKCFPAREVVLVGSRKSAELFSRDSHLEANYPRVGPVSQRMQFALALRERLRDGLVVDPDSRISQLGHVPMAEPGRYFHFNSRTAGGAAMANLSVLTADWLVETFGKAGEAYVQPAHRETGSSSMGAAVSLGVGGNASKRLDASFEAKLIRDLAERHPVVWIDRGAGGEEAARVNEAIARSGAADRIRCWDGSFAGFAGIIRQSRFYAGYDSAGQHAAAALGLPVVTYFVGAPSARFLARWSPFGKGPIEVRAQ